MFFLNLSLGQLLVLFGSVSAVAVTLYLLDRSRRRQTVATLRFWVNAEQPVAVRRRHRIQQPLSLLLQILSMGLLLLAVAQPRLGSPGATVRNHVLILDTSAWMGAQIQGGKRTLMQEAQDRARSYLRALPSSDRVMIVRADALTMPATVFETNRKKLEAAIAGSHPGSTALNLDQAIEFARHSQALSAGRAGEIAVIGSGRVSRRESAEPLQGPVSNLRFVPVTETVENCGLTKIGLRKAAADPDLWEIFVSARNYGKSAQTLPLTLRFGGAPAGSRRLQLPPGAERESTFEYRTRAAGLLEATLFTHDAFPQDDRAVLELPPQKSLSVAVYSDESELLRPILAANPRVNATFYPTKDYSAMPQRDLVILDRFRPPTVPAVDSIWIDPPIPGSPIPVRTRLTTPKVARWRSGHALGSGLRTQDLRLESATVFEAAPSDIRIAEVDGGPVIVARPGKPKIVVIGFHPARSGIRYELATPLLFGNLLRWTTPEIFRRWELTGGSVGSVKMTLDSDLAESDVRVLSEDGRTLPFTVRERTLNTFVGAPGTVRVIAGDREIVYSLTLPEVADTMWEPPAGIRRGIPPARQAGAGSREIWQLLAILGAAGLLLEWYLFGRLRRIWFPIRKPVFLRKAS